jgi:hypothetical protein
MNTATKLGVYVLGLTAVFAGAAAVGGFAGPGGGTTAAAGARQGGHQGMETEHPANAHPASETMPAGLQISQGGYTLVPETTTVPPGTRINLRFAITGSDGKAVTRFAPLHGKRLHFIVARRDLSGFQHLHPSAYSQARHPKSQPAGDARHGGLVNEPTEAGGGVWSVPLTLPSAGTYRAFTDIRPEGAKEQLTLGMDLFAPGDDRSQALPAPSRTTRVGDYAVTLTGGLVPGQAGRLTLSVTKNGRPVTDLQPYLKAYGHLVVLRHGDLAYLHVHPEGEPGDGKTRPGPDITFLAEAPSAGSYRLYLDFQHQGTVRTAEFTVTAH